MSRVPRRLPRFGACPVAPGPRIPWLPPNDWLVFFQPASSIWWHRLCKPGFAHCFAVSFQDYRWVVFDPAFHGLDVRVIPAEVMAEWMAKPGVTILRMPEVAQDLFRPRWVITCAGAIAALVGLRATPLTPWGLVCRLRRAGAEDYHVGSAPKPTYTGPTPEELAKQERAKREAEAKSAEAAARLAEDDAALTAGLRGRAGLLSAVGDLGFGLGGA